MKKITIKQAIQRLNTSKATLYKYIKQCEIITIKERNKTYLLEEQLEELRRAIKERKQRSTAVFKTEKTLKKQLEEQEKKLAEEKQKNKVLKLEQGKTNFENERLKTKNIQLETRAEVLDEQNKKIIFQMGATAEKMALLTVENQKLIEISEIQEKRGFFSKLFNFSKK